MERELAGGMHRVSNEWNVNRGVALQSLKSVTGATQSEGVPSQAYFVDFLYVQ